MASVKASRQEAATAKPDSLRTRVILVEDDNELREGLADYLRLSGIEVTEAASGIAFYKVMRTQTFDIAIIDINLPDTSGYELTRELAQERKMGIIVLTAMSTREARKRGFEEGADLFLTKPVDGDELLTTVRNLSRRVRQSGPAASEADGGKPIWRLNRHRSRLTAPDGRAVQLSGREVILLEQFAAADGEPVARSSLADALGYGTPSSGNRSLDAALRRLRQKAAANNADLPLQAVHAVGVRFIDGLIVV